MGSTDFVSIIVTHWSNNDDRSRFMRSSLDSLFRSTNYPFELIVVDNGEKKEDSLYLLDLLDQGKINVYIKNQNNMHFSYARNQALELAQGDYICIADNDIHYKHFWLEKCINVLKAHPHEKWYATPRDYPHDAYNDKVRYRTETFEFDGEMYSLNMRAGSNCMVIHRDRLKDIGNFPVHRIGGTKWTDKAVKAGYLAVVLPDGYSEDIGLRQGYNMNDIKPVRIKLSSGKEIYFNQDEFSSNSGIHCIQQRAFSC